MNHFLRRYGMIISLLITALLLSGCVVETSKVTFQLSDPLSSSQTIHVRYSDEIEPRTPSDQTGTSFSIETADPKWYIGTYINEGNLNWVPQLSYNGVEGSGELDVMVSDIEETKPTIAAAYAVKQGSAVPFDSNSEYVSVTFAVYGSNDELVDGQTAVFAHTDKDIHFYNNDSKDNDNDWYVRTDYIAEGIASYTEEGFVTFVIEANSVDELSSVPLQLYSGTTKIYDSLNTLSALSLSSGELTPDFNPETTSYTVNVPYNVASVSVTASLYDSANGITLNGNLITSGQASGELALNVGENTITLEVTFPHTPPTTYTVTVTRAAQSTSPPSNTDTGYVIPSVPSIVKSTDGQIKLPVGFQGEVSVENELTIAIPANASQRELELSITKVTNTQGLLTISQVLASPVFEILKNFTENFIKPVTLSFVFDPTSLQSDQIPTVFYYDEDKKEWVEVEGGKVVGNIIHVEVDHFTKFAVFAVGSATDTPETDTITEANLIDISGHWAEASIKQAVKSGIVKGYPDGSFKPGATVTRAEFAVMLMNTLKPQVDGTTLTFTDKADIKDWAQKAVVQAVQLGIIDGYEDDTFRPNANMSRSEMAVMIANALNLSTNVITSTDFADDKAIPDWAKGAVVILKEKGVMEGTNSHEFNPNGRTTRAEAIIALLKVLDQS